MQGKLGVGSPVLALILAIIAIAPSSVAQPPAEAPAIPALASFIGMRIGYSTVEDFERRLGPGLPVTGGHPQGARVWYIRNAHAQLWLDGFDYSERGRVVDQIVLSRDAFPSRPSGVPKIEVSHRMLGLRDRVYLGMTEAQVLRQAKGLLPPLRQVQKGCCSAWTGPAFACVAHGDVRLGSYHDELYDTWTTRLDFDHGRLAAIEIDME